MQEPIGSTLRPRHTLSPFVPLLLALIATPGCGEPPASDDDEALPADSDPVTVTNRGRWWWRHRDLAVATDMARTNPDLRMQPSPDLLVKPSPDLAVTPRDLGAPADLAVVAGPQVRALEPASGPPGTILTVSGSGFQMGDTVEVSGTNLGPTKLAVVSLTASAIVAALPALNIALPAALTVRVARNGAAYGNLAFQAKAGRVFYVSPNGNDGSSGSINAPFRTLSGAASHLAPGDVAYFRAGTYPNPAHVTVSGSAGAPITFRGYPGERAVLSNPSTSGSWETVVVGGAYIVFDHLAVTDQHEPGNALTIDHAAHHVTVSNGELFGARGQGILILGNDNLVYRNEIHDNGTHTGHDHGVYVTGARNVIRSNRIWNNNTYGVQLYNETAVGGNAVVEYNYIYHNGQGAQAQGYNFAGGIVIATGQPSAIVRYNRLCDNARFGLYHNNSQPSAQITGNVTCYNSGGGLYFDVPGAGTVATGNISFNDGGYALFSRSAVTSDGDDFYSTGAAPRFGWNGSGYDLAGFQRASGQDAHSTLADPRFRNVPGTGFNAAAATGYDFCNTFNPKLCDPLP